MPSLPTQLVDENAVHNFVVLLASPAFAAPTVSCAAYLRHDLVPTVADILLAP